MEKDKQPELEPMESVLQLVRQCSYQQRLLRLSASRQDELLGELEDKLLSVSERVTATPPPSPPPASTAPEKDRLRAPQAVQLAFRSPTSSKGDLSEHSNHNSNSRSGSGRSENAPLKPKPTLTGLSGDIYDTIYTPSHYTRLKAQKTKQPCLRGMLTVVGDCLFKLENINEPPRKGIIPDLIFSRWFQMLSVFVILVNSVSIALSADYEIQNLGQEATQVQQNVELALACFYVVELALKLVVHRLYFFVNNESAWNCFDFCLVLFSIVEYAVKIHLEIQAADPSGGGGGVNVGFLRIFRLCKIAKVLRVFRTLRFFTDLRLMMDCCLGSFMNVFWCLAMIVFVLYVFSLLIVQGLTEYLVSAENLDETYKRDVMRFFGSVGSAIVTLFQSTTAGIDWNDAYSLLQVSGLMPSICFLTYVIIFTISVWNIVTSTFVEKAMKLAQPDLESMIFEKNVKDAKDAEDLSKLFRPYTTANNEEGEPVISLEQIRGAAEQPRFRQDLAVRGVDIKNVEVFFQMLSTFNEGDVRLKTLVSACVRMKGVATSIDLQSMGFEIHMISSLVESRFKEQDAQLRSIEQLLGCMLDGSLSGAEKPGEKLWGGNFEDGRPSRPHVEIANLEEVRSPKEVAPRPALGRSDLPNCGFLNCGARE
ncbi:unnamed protein product [Effrenium voratum]|uniref:Ion transport domain-containing protein n=1 Tax=Effrenium voratum TaxID=2562239 RepID=A0AA36J1P6_9DINO|nr:unnamed protein product [Effrenium voratum]